LRSKRNADSADINEFRGFFSSYNYKLINSSISQLSALGGEKKSSGDNAEIGFFIREIR